MEDINVTTGAWERTVNVYIRFALRGPIVEFPWPRVTMMIIVI